MNINKIIHKIMGFNMKKLILFLLILQLYQNTTKVFSQCGEYSLYFNSASTQYVSTNDLISAPNVLTIELWFKTTTTTGGKLIERGTTQGLSGGYDRHIWMSDDGRISFGIHNTIGYSITSTSSYNDGNWHHVAATFSGNGMVLYIDGNLIGTNSNNSSNANWDGYWKIGYGYCNLWIPTSTSWYFTGNIDEVRIWSIERTQSQIQDNKNYKLNGDESGLTYYWRFDEGSGSIIDDATSNNNMANLQNNPTWVDEGFPCFELTTITTTTINGSPFCAGKGVPAPFTIVGTYNSGNIFTAQLSNSSGNFSSPTTIGTLTGTTAGTINATIPKSTSAGTGYRIRVISSDPAVTGSDNGTNLTINSVPSPVITGSTSFCKDEIIVFKSNTAGGLTYSWTVTGGTIIGQTNLDSLIVNWTTAGNGKVKLVQTNSNGCKDSIENNITINNAPNPSIQSGQMQVCEKKTYSYTSNNDPNVNFFWTAEKGSIESGATSQTVNIKWDSVGIATNGKIKLVQINKSTGCKDSVESNVTINPMPRVSILGSDTVGLNRKDYYKAKDSTGLTSAWLATGGTIINNPMNHWVIVDWKTVGQGTLKLTQTAVASGCIDTAVISVTILDNPPISITVSDSACENKESVYSTATGTNIEYKWTCTQGTIQGKDNQSTVVIKWGQAGNGSVKLVRYNTEMKTYDSTSKNIRIHSLPQINIQNVTDTVFLGSKVKYWVKPGTAESLKWKVTKGTILGADNKDTVEINWTGEGKGTINLNATSSVGCEDSSEVSIEIQQKSGVIIQHYGKNEVCQNDTASYTTPIIIDAMNKWNVTGGTIINQTNTKINVLWEQAGTGKVKLVQDIPTIGIKDSNEIQVKVNPQPIVTIPDFPDICIKDTTYQITGAKPAGGNYFINAINNTTFNPINLGAGTHVIKYEYTDSLGCSNYAETTFEIHPEPKQPTITENGNVLTASPGSKFRWYYQGKIIPGATGSTHNPDKSGIYSVMSIDDIGCESKLSELHYYPLGSDGSIIVGDFERKFGIIVCEYSKYDTVNIQNPGKETLTISKAEIRGKNKDDFKIIPSFQQTDIPTKGKKEFIIQFLPTVAGEKEAELALTNNSVNDKEFKVSLTATKDSIGFILSETQLNFDYVPENTPQIKEITLTNTGTLPLTWQPAIDINKDFEIISIKPATTEPNGGTSTIRVIFNGEADGYKTNTEYTFSENQCSRQVKLTLKAIVGNKPVDAIAVLKIDTLDMIYRPGDILQVPIYLKSSQNLDKVTITGFTADLVYNATLLIPTMGTPLGTRVNDVRKIPLTLPVNPKYDNVLDVLNFQATLGNDTTTTLILENLKTIGNPIEINKIDGRFTLAGVCMEGGVPRLLNTSNQIQLKLLKPNPTENKLTIDYELIETGLTDIYLMNTFGERIKTIISKETRKGIYSIDADLSDIGSGLYFIILETPTVRKTEKIEILK